jgi:prepilin-type N-terminal cleavage/methylation domain-containing protein
MRRDGSSLRNAPVLRAEFLPQERVGLEAASPARRLMRPGGFTLVELILATLIAVVLAADAP